jgi:hypothetical protein
MGTARATIFLAGEATGTQLSVRQFIGDPEDVGFDLREAGFRVDKTCNPAQIKLDAGVEETAAAIALLRSWGYAVVLVGA